MRTRGGRYHRNVVLTGNTIRSFNGNVADAKSVENLTIRDNQVLFSTDYPAHAPKESVRLKYSRNVQVTGNTATGFAAPLTVTASPDCELIQTTENRGWKSP